MKIHELQTLDFSDAIERLDEKIVSTKLELEKLIVKVEDNTDAEVLAQELTQQQAATEAKLVLLREKKSYDLSGRNDTIMKEVIDALDSISEGIQKMLRLL